MLAVDGVDSESRSRSTSTSFETSVKEGKPEGDQTSPIPATIEEQTLASTASPSMKASPDPSTFACTTTTTSAHLPIPSFSSQFSAAHLFGLLENGLVHQQHKMDTTPMQSNGYGGHVLPKSTFPIPSTTAATFSFNNGSTITPVVTKTAPIDQLLQISQQIFGDSMVKQQQQQQQQIFNQLNMPTTVGRRGSGGSRAKAAENGGDGASSGKQISESGGGNERKRSYPYTFQFCVLCQKNVHSSKLPCHIRQCHVGKPMFQCPVCDFTSTYSKNNVKSHMVSLHGLAGDPISYMDQYAVQVEDFMKKCFPNVRGRGRPIHGRFSPAKQQRQQQQLLSSPASTVASSGASSAADHMGLLGNPPSSADLKTPVHTPQRRNSAALAFLTNGCGGGQGLQQTPPPQHSQPRGRQRAQRAAANNNNRHNNNNNDGGGGAANNGAGNTVASSRALHFAEQQANLYGTATGMLLANGGGGSTSPRNNEHMSMVERVMLPNGFPASTAPTFNPFLYLQQLNGLFPSTFHANLDFKNVHRTTDQLGKLDTEMESNAGTLLEECLTLSQKFLRELSNDDGSNDNGVKQSHNHENGAITGEEEEEDEHHFDSGNGEENGSSGCSNHLGLGGAKESTILTASCHSSSSMGSPPSRASFSASATASRNVFGSSDLVDEPRYFPHSFAGWTLLEGPSLEKTVFNTFSSSNLIEKFDLSLFEPLLNQNAAGTLLTPAQRARVAEVRRQLGVETFEIRYAMHRLDPNILKRNQVQLVQQIAPTRADIRRFELLEQSNSLGSLDEDEKFILELSKVERLKEKLSVLTLMATFDEQLAQINQQLQSFAFAAKLLFNSAQFHTLLHLLLTSVNLISGNFNAQLVKGFHPSRIGAICAFRFPNGDTLLEVLAQIVRKSFPELLSFTGKHCNAVGEAAKVEFAGVISALHSLERGQSLVEEELQLTGGETRNQQLASFLTHYSVECAQLKEAVRSTKNQLLSTLEYFGETGTGAEEILEANFQPERFFFVIYQFLKDLQSATANVD